MLLPITDPTGPTKLVESNIRWLVDSCWLSIVVVVSYRHVQVGFEEHRNQRCSKFRCMLAQNGFFLRDRAVELV